MKRKCIAIVMLSSIFSLIASSQIIDVEKTVRAKVADTTQGWKRGGVISINLAQTSLTNWAAGGQNSCCKWPSQYLCEL